MRHRLSLKGYFEYLPLFDQKLTFGVPCEGEAGIGRAYVLAVVVADGELGVGAFFVGVVDDADVAASEDGSFFGVVGYGELHQIQGEFLLHVDAEDKLFRVLSAAHCFLAELHATGVYPPIILPNSVSNSTTVPDIPSHFLWNSLMEKAFSEALKIRLTSNILSSKKLEMTPSSCMILLLSPAGALIYASVKGTDASVSQF